MATQRKENLKYAHSASGRFRFAHAPGSHTSQVLNVSGLDRLVKFSANLLVSLSSISWLTRKRSEPSGSKYRPFPISLIKDLIPISEASQQKKYPPGLSTPHMEFSMASKSKLHLSPETPIENIIPRKNRIKNVKTLENILDMRLFLLSPPTWLILALIAVFLLSLVAFFIDGTIAVSGIAFSILGFKIANRLGKKIDIKTVGELTDNMVSFNYVKSRRDPNTVNRRELDDVIKSIFIKEFQLSPSALNKEAKFGKY